MRQFLEVESAHYKDLGVYITGDGQSRLDLYKDGNKVDTINIYRWSIEEVRRLMDLLGLERDESITYEKKKAEAKLAEAFAGGMKKKEDL